MKTSSRGWRFAVLSLSLVPLLALACGTLEVGIVPGNPTAGPPPTQYPVPTPSVTPLLPLSTPSPDVDGTISALATMNAYLATRVAAQGAPGQNLEPTVSALATMSSYLATRGPARITPAPDATFTPAPGRTPVATSAAAPTPAEGSGAAPTPAEGSAAAPTPAEGSAAAPTPYCRPGEAWVDVSASATRLEVGQAVSVSVTLTNGDASDVKLGLIQYALDVHPSGVLTSDDLEPVEHPLTLEPGQSDGAEFVLRASTPGRATLTGSASFEMHALDYAWGSWSGCRSWPLEIIVHLDPPVLTQHQQILVAADDIVGHALDSAGNDGIVLGIAGHARQFELTRRHLCLGEKGCENSVHLSLLQVYALGDPWIVEDVDQLPHQVGRGHQREVFIQPGVDDLARMTFGGQQPTDEDVGVQDDPGLVLIRHCPPSGAAVRSTRPVPP